MDEAGVAPAKDQVQLVGIPVERSKKFKHWPLQMVSMVLKLAVGAVVQLLIVMVCETLSVPLALLATSIMV